jgi:hypothetical protein
VTLPPQIARLLGLPAGETLGLDRLTFAVSTPDRAMLGTGLDRLDQDGAGFDMACRLADGVRTVACRGDRLPADGADGPMNRLTITEVSQVAAAATVIANEKYRLQAALDVMPMPVWPPQRPTEYCNKAMPAAWRSCGRADARENKPQSDDKHGAAGDRRLMTVTDAAGRRRPSATPTRPRSTGTGRAETPCAPMPTCWKACRPPSPSSTPTVAASTTANTQAVRPGGGIPHQRADLNEVLSAARAPPHPNMPTSRNTSASGARAVRLHPMEELLHLPDGSTLRMVAAPSARRSPSAMRT